MFPAGLPMSRPSCRPRLGIIGPGTHDESDDTDMIKRHPLVIFILLTFGLTWVVWVPRAPCRRTGRHARTTVDVGSGGRSSGRGRTHRRSRSDGRSAAAAGALARRMVVVSAGDPWPGRTPAVVAGLYVLAGGSWQEAAPEAFRLSIPTLAILFGASIMTDGLGEELAWRGFALPRLLQRWPEVTASLILGLVWAACALPAPVD